MMEIEGVIYHKKSETNVITNPHTEPAEPRQQQDPPAMTADSNDQPGDKPVDADTSELDTKRQKTR